MVMKKRQFLTVTLVIALAAAVFVNWYYTEPTKNSNIDSKLTTQQNSMNLGDSVYVAGTTKSSSENSSESEQGYFAKARLNKEKAHDKIIDSVEEIIDRDGINDENSKDISDMLNKFKSDIKSEADTENLITAKTGFECVVVINDKNCQVVMQKNSLNDTVILQITEIISKNTDISAENLTIIEVK